MTSTEPLYFYSPGACSLGGMIVLEQLGQPYRLCRVERAERTTDAYRRVHPQAKVPALRLGARVLTENGAILAHLGERRPELGLVPPCGTAERDTVNEWLSYLASAFHVAFYPYFMPARYVADPALYSAIKDVSLHRIRVELTHVEASLASGHLAGERETVLDPYLYAMSRWARSTFDIPAEFPRLAKHQAAMEATPAARFALALERGEEAASPSGAFLGHVALDALK